MHAIAVCVVGLFSERAAMRLNEYMSQLLLSLQWSWTEIEVQL